MLSDEKARKIESKEIQHIILVTDFPRRLFKEAHQNKTSKRNSLSSLSILKYENSFLTVSPLLEFEHGSFDDCQF